MTTPVNGIRNKLLMFAQERFDLPDFVQGLQGYLETDFQTLAKGLVTNAQTYITRGLTVSPVGGLDVNVNVADSVLFHGASDGSFYVSATTTPPEVRTMLNNADTYIWGEITSVNDTTTYARVFWDPTLVNPLDPTKFGAEFIQNVPIKKFLAIDIKTGPIDPVTNGFPAGTNVIPICIVTAAAGAITFYTDSRHLLWRLGTGGTTQIGGLTPPNIDNITTWSVARTDLAGSHGSSAPALFGRGDRQFTCLKDWMDAVMSMIKEVKFGAATGPAAVWTAPAPASLSDENIEITGGGVWTWTLGTNSLSFTADATILIPETAYINRILVGSSPIVLPPAHVSEGEYVAWVTIDRTSSAALTVTVSTQDAYVALPDRFIVARRILNSAYIGIK